MDAEVMGLPTFGTPARPNAKRKLADVAEHAGMDLDASSSDHSSSEQVQSTLTPSKTNGKGKERAHEQDSDLLGSSISRSARMRATTTEDESASGSEEEVYSSDDNEFHATALQNFSNTTSHGTFVTASNGEAYLRAMSRPAKTSNTKLSESWSVQQAFTQASYLAALREAGTSKRGLDLERRLLQVEDSYSALHEQWDFELQEGFSIFFYGLGSKIRVLEKFINTFLKRKKKRQGRVVVINGFMATLTVDDILSSLENILHRVGGIGDDELASRSGKSAAKLDERTRLLVEDLRSPTCHFTAKKPIYLVIHNIDGIGLRTFRTQAILSILASLPQIKLLASIDHVKASLLFPSSIASARPTSTGDSHMQGYKVIYHHIPTHRPYTLETLLSGTMASILPPSIFQSDPASTKSGSVGLAGSSSESRARAAYFVLASLTQKSKDVFVLLAERQISLCANSRTKSSSSMDTEKAPLHATQYATLFSLARDRFLANNVNQFEALLREYRDHDVILSSTTKPDGIDDDEIDEVERHDVGKKSEEWIWIGVEKSDLETLLEKLET